MSEKLSQIKGNPDNPRTIRDEVKERLNYNLEKYGDLSGLVVNKDGTVISGHQRKDHFLKKKGKIEITERYKTPQPDGTIARGWVVLNDGNKYVFRRVDWDKRTAQEATIIANGTFGEWDTGVVTDVWAKSFEITELLEMGMPAWVFGDKADLTQDELVQFFAKRDGDGKPGMEKIILHFAPGVYERVMEALEAIADTPEAAILKLLELE